MSIRFLSYKKRRTGSKKNRGVALFVAIVISAIVLTIGVGIVTTVFKEIRFSQFGKQSAEAFYAADAGLECALYWDSYVGAQNRRIFATSSDSSIVTGGVAKCIKDAGWEELRNRDDWNILDSPTAATTTFTLRYPPDHANQDEPCVAVTVAKYQDSGQRTKIEARGRNSCNTNDSRRVERAVRVIY